MSASAKKDYRPETRLVQSGTLRSQFGETSEALFLTQGYVYDTPQQAEARFKGEDPGYHLFALRQSDRRRCSSAAWRLLEGAEAARATATGMAAVTAALVGQLKAGDHVVASKAMFGSCLYVVEELSAALRRRLDAGRRLRSRRLAQRDAAQHQDLLSGKPDQSGARRDRHRRSGEDRARGRRDAGRRQCVRHAAVAEARWRSAPIASSIRRPSTSTARAAVSAASFSAREKFIMDTYPQLPAPDRPVAVAVQRLGDAEVAGDAAVRVAAQTDSAATHRRCAGRASESLAR